MDENCELEGSIELRLEGEAARDGISMTAFEGFIEEFVKALRAFDRVRQGQQPVRSGQPGKRGEAVSSLKIVSLTRGSAVLLLEPYADEVDSDATLAHVETLAMANVRGLLDALDAKEELGSEVVDALGAARRKLGPQGVVNIAAAREGKRHSVRLDTEKIAELSAPSVSAIAREMTVSGRLHMIDTEPPIKIGIRGGDGIDWRCRFPEALGPRVHDLLDRNVWARGQGKLTGALTGNLEIEELHQVGELSQTSFFTFEHPTLSALQEAQGVYSPQGPTPDLPELREDELDAYLEALGAE
jgi:hypothetical protein